MAYETSGSPFFALKHLIEQMDQGQIEPDALRQQLDNFDLMLEDWNDGFSQIPSEPEAEEHLQALDSTKDAIEAFAQSSSWLRQFLEGDESGLEEALAAAQEGHEILTSAIDALVPRVKDLQNEVG